MNMNNPNTSTFYPKQLTDFELYKLGISVENFNIVNTLEELRNSPPNIIIAKCVNNVQFTQNKFAKQTLIKKNRYVMGAGVYMQLHCDTRTNMEFLKPSEIQFKKIYRHYNGQNLDNKSILIFRQGGIGDLLFIQPNLSYLKQKYPTCTIKIACGPQYQSMVKEWECVDQVLDLPFLIDELFKADYHCVFEGVIERCKEAENTCAYNLFSNWMGLKLPDELLVPKQKPNKILVDKAKEFLKRVGLEEKNFIVLQMKASSPIRTPDPKIWIKLIDILTEKGHNIIVTDNPLISKDIDGIISQLKNQDKVKNFTKDSETIGDTIALISLAKLVIATDSALPHIAESVGVKSFGIMGPFPGEIRFSTYNNNDWINVTREECSPCFSHGTQPCKNSNQSYSMCYNYLDYDLAIEKIERLLEDV